MTGHIGIAEIDIVFINSYNTIHYMFHLSFTVTFRISPLTVNDIFFSNFRTHLHQLIFHQVLNLFNTDGRRGKITDYPHGDISNKFLFIVYSGCMECFTDCIFNFTDREVFPLPISFDDTNLSVIHCLKI